MVQIVPEKCLNFSYLLLEKVQTAVESCDAAKLLCSFRTGSILKSVSFHCFLAHVELEKELFAAWNQVPWPCKGRSKTTTG